MREIEIIGNTHGAGWNGDDASFPYILVPGWKRILIISVTGLSHEAWPPTPSVSFGGVNATLLAHTIDESFVVAAIFGIYEDDLPTDGSHTVNIGMVSDVYYGSAAVALFRNVKQQAPVWVGGVGKDESYPLQVPIATDTSLVYSVAASLYNKYLADDFGHQATLFHSSSGGGTAHHTYSLSLPSPETEISMRTDMRDDRNSIAVLEKEVAPAPFRPCIIG
jgi:hypothetical protein